MPESPKKRLRSQMRQKLQVLEQNTEHKKRCDHFISQRLWAFLGKVIRKPTFIGIYSPLPDEPVWFECFEKASEEAGSERPPILLAMPGPCQKTKTMRFYRTELRCVKNWVEGIFWDTTQQEVVTPEIVLTPGLCFSPDGNRLGRGGGFYDRFFETFKGIRLGICYQGQIWEGEFPREAHDQTMHAVVTDQTIYTACKHIQQKLEHL